MQENLKLLKLAEIQDKIGNHQLADELTKIAQQKNFMDYAKKGRTITYGTIQELIATGSLFSNEASPQVTNAKIDEAIKIVRQAFMPTNFVPDARDEIEFERNFDITNFKK